MTKNTILIHIIGGERSAPTITPIKAHYEALTTTDEHDNEYIVGLGIFYRHGGYHITDIYTGLDCTPRYRESGETCLRWTKDILDEALKMLAGLNIKRLHEYPEHVRFHEMIENFKRGNNNDT